MTWKIEFLEEAKKDLLRLNHSTQIQVLKGISKVAQNPLPVSEGGYGKPLGNKGKTKLTNLLKIKFKDLGIRVVYKIERTETEMLIIIIAARAHNELLHPDRLRVKSEKVEQIGVCIIDSDLEVIRISVEQL